MNLEEMKSIATKLLFASECGDAETATALTTDDFFFQYMARGTSWEAYEDEGGLRLTKENFIKNGINVVNQITQDGMHFKVFLAIAEGNYVAIFGESNAKSKEGKVYNNRYCWKFTFSGDKVSEFLEFCDTDHAKQQLFS